MNNSGSMKGLKINISTQQALDSIKDYVISFGWTFFKFKEMDRLKLFMIPFYLFHFDVFKTIKNQGKETVSDETSGVLSLDAAKNKLDAQVARFFGLHEPIEKIDLNIDSLDYKILESNISDEKAEEIIKVKLASKFNVSLENIIVSGKKLLFIPVYYSEIELNNEFFVIKVNGFDGKVFSDKLIPVRKKNLSQLFSETITDLKQPDKWANYSTGSISSVLKVNSGILFQFSVIVLILLMIAVFLVFIGLL
jgi:hypothetical protein